MITLYHATNEKHKDDILKNGLKTNNGRVYLSDIPRHAFGNTCFSVTLEKNMVQQTINKWEYICNADIPPECIKFHSFEEDE